METRKIGQGLGFLFTSTAISSAFGLTSYLSAETSKNVDNSKKNRRDVTIESMPTADQQENTKESIESTRKIRAALVEEKSLSTYSHNIKIVTVGNEVYLRGPVESQAEKNKVEEIAVKAAGSIPVKSELEVKTN